MADTLSRASLKEVTEDIAEELEAQVYMFTKMLKQQVPRWRRFKKRQEKIPVWWGLQDMSVCY